MKINIRKESVSKGVVRTLTLILDQVYALSTHYSYIFSFNANFFEEKKTFKQIYINEN